MASHARKLWAGGILLALGGTAAAAMSADPPTATEKASGTAPVEVRTEVIHKTVHKRAKAHRSARAASPSSGRGGAARAATAPAQARAAVRPATAAAPFVSRGGDDHQRGRGRDDERGEDHGVEREHEPEDEVEHEDRHGGGDD